MVESESNMDDLKVTCVECEKEFTIPVAEQEWLRDRHFVNPKRCRKCRAQRRKEKANQ